MERFCWAAAVACLLPYAIATGAREYYSWTSASWNNWNNIETPNQLAEGRNVPEAYDSTDNSSSAYRRPKDLWAPQRLRSFMRYKSGVVPSADAVLSLPRQEVAIPVFSGTSELAMTLGAGHITDTSPLEGSGNIAVSAHRDGSFRILKDVEVGDPLVLSVGGRDRLFVVKRQSIVEPEQVEVLAPTPITTLTLVTCYPFYFIGEAPQRYIVQAEIVNSPEARQALGWTPGYAAHSYWGSAHRMRRNDI